NFCNSFTNLSWRIYYVDSALFHDFHFGLSCIVFSSNDCSSVSHGSSFWCCLSGDKTYNRFFRTAFFVPSSCFCFQLTTDLTDHYDRLGIRVVDEKFQCFFGGSSDDRVSSD